MRHRLVPEKIASVLQEADTNGTAAQACRGAARSFDSTGAPAVIPSRRPLKTALGGPLLVEARPISASRRTRNCVIDSAVVPTQLDRSGRPSLVSPRCAAIVVDAQHSANLGIVGTPAIVVGHVAWVMPKLLRR